MMQYRKSVNFFPLYIWWYFLYWHATAGMYNAAFRQQAKQSSVAPGSNAGLAVDGVFSIHELTSCAQTIPYTLNFWQLDLGQSLWIASIFFIGTNNTCCSKNSLSFFMQQFCVDVISVKLFDNYCIFINTSIAS